MPFDCYQWFGHDTGRREIRTKITQFQPKTHCWGDIGLCPRRPKFSAEGHNWWRIMGLWLWRWNQSSNIPMEAAARAKTEIEGRPEQDHKKWFFEVLRGLEKTLAQVYNIRWELLWRGQNRYSWINKSFLKKHKIRETFWTHFVSCLGDLAVWIT